MGQKLDKEIEYGLVLEGGGAKGAYQIGVWKALRECGIKIRGIAGVSVGALNGALICMDDVNQAEEIWSNISYSKVMEVDDETVDHLLHGRLKELSLASVTKSGAKVMAARGVDITPLKNLLKTYVDEEAIKASKTELYMGTLSLTDRKEVEIDVKELEDGELEKYLIASASLPGFQQEKLEGKTFLDGGMVNNVPIDMLVKREYKDIIVVRIYGIGVERKVKLPEDVHVYEIAPRVELGNILEFTREKAIRNIKIGYCDGLRAIKDLQGKIYYLDVVNEETLYANRFLAMHPMVKMALLEYFKEDYKEEVFYHRRFFEKVLPQAADKLGLTKNWTYQELYLSWLELAAKNLKVNKYRVYTEEEFVEAILENAIGYQKEVESMDVFIQLIIKAVTIVEV